MSSIFKFIYRLVLNILMLVFVSLPLELLGIIILLPVVYWNQRKLLSGGSCQLPYILRWFDCADIYSKFKRDPFTYFARVIPNGVLYRYYWLALRNPCNYFGYNVLGFRSDLDIPSTDIGDMTGGQPGLHTVESQGRYEYYLIYKWNDKKCFRFRMGWKLSDTKTGDFVQRVFVVQPYKDYFGN